MNSSLSILSIFLIIIASGVSASQTTTSASTSDRTKEIEIDRYVEGEMRRYKIPGISLAVLRNGKISLLKSYGLANVELNIPVKPETIFQSGSIGKQFTAAAVMILVQEGKISLDDKISKYLRNTPEAWKDITIRSLLNHTSGLGDYPDEINLRGDYTEDQYLEIFKKAPLNFATGTKWDYSNVGYVTLGILIGKLTGKSYGEFLQEKIFRPFGMSTTRVISEEDIVPNRAAGYRLVNGELKNQEWVSPSTNSTADGSYYVSILDMAKWDAGLTAAGNSVLTPATLSEAWTPARLSSGLTKGYGFGWFTDTIHNRRVVFHGGAWQGFKSYIIRFLDEKLTIIFLANSWAANDFKIARGLMTIFDPAFALKNQGKPLAARDPKADDLFRRVLMQLTNDKPDKDSFTAEAQEQLFPTSTQRFGEVLRSLTLPVAVIHLSELIGRSDEGNLRVYTYQLVDIGQTLVCKMKLTKDDRIASLDVSKVW